MILGREIHIRFFIGNLTYIHSQIENDHRFNFILIFFFFFFLQITAHPPQPDRQTDILLTERKSIQIYFS